MGQRAQGGGRVVDQGLLVSVEHFITHRGDHGARLPLAAGAELHQLFQDRLGGSASLRSRHSGIPWAARICAWVNLGSTRSLRDVSSFNQTLTADINQMRALVPRHS